LLAILEVIGSTVTSVELDKKLNVVFIRLLRARAMVDYHAQEIVPDQLHTGLAAASFPKAETNGASDSDLIDLATADDHALLVTTSGHLLMHPSSTAGELLVLGRSAALRAGAFADLSAQRVWPFLLHDACWSQVLSVCAQPPQ
jgi:hypothetical protein